MRAVLREPGAFDQAAVADDGDAFEAEGLFGEDGEVTCFFLVSFRL